MSRCFPYLLALMLGIASWSSLAQMTKSSPRSLVIESRRHYAKGTFPRTGGWQGLYCRGLDCEIRPARVRIKTASAVNVLDEKELLDDLRVSGKPLALFPGGGLKEGKLVSWYRAGDLDGDGKLDLLLSIPDDNCGFDERLYLSTGVGKGQLLRKAAQLSGGEAACGC